jgi:hypothetical protein
MKQDISLNPLYDDNWDACLGWVGGPGDRYNA